MLIPTQVCINENSKKFGEVYVLKRSAIYIEFTENYFAVWYVRIGGGLLMIIVWVLERFIVSLLVTVHS